MKCLSILAGDHKFQNRGTVYCYEISTCTPKNKQYVQLLHHIQLADQLQPDDLLQDADQLRQFWKAGDATCHSRLVVVEDISQPLIELLGNTLELDPLVFIQHLKGSGVNNDSLDPLVGSQCIDTFLGTHIVSAQWYRPVGRFLKDQKKKKGLSLLQNPWPTGGSDSEALRLRVRRLENLPRREGDRDTETNICRVPWEIGSRSPSIPNTDDHTTTVPAAWEERVTIYRESRGGITFGELGFLTRVSSLY